MKRTAMLMIALSLAWGSVVEPVEAGVEISCVGGACNQFGTLDYNYVLQNTGTAPVVVTQFYIASRDFTLANYSSFSAPAGFQVKIGNWQFLGSTYGTSARTTTKVFTEHDVVPAVVPEQSAAGILFTNGTFTLQPGGTVAFGFNHGWDPQDMGWRVNHPEGQNSSEGYVEDPMAGPWETYGWGPGFVHGPGVEPTPVLESTWGRVKRLFAQ